MSVSGNKSSGSSSSQSNSTSWDYGTNVWGVQSPYLQDLYQQAQTNLPNAGDRATDFTKQAQYALGQGQGALERSNAAFQRLMDPQNDPALQAYATNLGQQFNEQFLPGLKGDAALAGGLGGSRQQIGSALGAQRAMQSLTDFTAQTYGANQDRALTAAQSMASNTGQWQNAASMYGQLADFARSMPWYNLNQYAGLLGSPVMQDLGGYSTSSSSSKGKQSSMGGSFGLGGG